MHIFNLGQERKANLERTCKAYQIIREAAELDSFIKAREQQAVTFEVGDDFELLECLQLKFNDFQSNINSAKERFANLNDVGEQLVDLDPGEATLAMKTHLDDLKEKWNNLQLAVEDRAELLEKANQINSFQKDAEEIEQLLHEKANYIHVSSDLGNDLKSALLLLQRHNEKSKELEVIDEKIKDLEKQATKLIEIFPERREEILAILKGLKNSWIELCRISESRLKNLDDSCNLQKFLSEWRELEIWANYFGELFIDSKLTDDLSRAEALLNQHKSFKNDMDKKSESLKPFEVFAQHLLTSNHYASVMIEEKLIEMLKLWEDLESTWLLIYLELENALKLQIFERDCFLAENWITLRMDTLSTENVEEDAEDLIRKLKNIEDDAKNRDENIKSISSIADQLIAENNPSQEEIVERKKNLLAIWKSFNNTLLQKKFTLEKQLRLKKFFQDADEVEKWIERQSQGTKEPNLESKGKIKVAIIMTLRT